MYYVEIYRTIEGWSGSWTLVGQYATRAEAARYATELRSRGERVRITTDE